MIQEIKHILKNSIEVKEKILESEFLIEQIDETCKLINESLLNGGKVILCGNGGSASDSIHIAGEMLGRFKLEREAIPAITLNADIASLTAISNDYGFENVYVRQLMGLMNKEDIFIGISTSGNSKNVLNAIRWAKEKGRKTIALLGNDGGDIKRYADIPIIIPSQDAARIQEAHITIGHILCELIELELTK